MQKLGFSDFSLLQARFILTGCLVLFSISFSGLCIMFGCSSIFYFIDNYKQDAPKTHTLPKWFIREIATHPSRSRLVLSSIALVLPAIISLCQAEGRDFSERFTISLWLYTFSMIPGVVYFVLWRDFITNKRRINSTQDYVFLSLAYLFCFFVYIVPFAQYIYPRILNKLAEETQNSTNYFC
ncbi:hypothetical protein [Chroococcidiopsis sp. SAG 2025]|uniref:hypothetical protein n=1 Tax=Chroococcidiopsis sp. SAG 2025 TaxID=171389 RepID=UPI002936DE1A|nr:hypothetical protein [Chroococcidiopsis sp. SAG 2025]